MRPPRQPARSPKLELGPELERVWSGVNVKRYRRSGCLATHGHHGRVLFVGSVLNDLLPERAKKKGDLGNRKYEMDKAMAKRPPFGWIPTWAAR